MSIAIPLHLVAAVLWVGGMWFAYGVLRPASTTLPPPERLRLWAEVLGRFFTLIWGAIVILLVSGYWVVFVVYGGLFAARTFVNLMQIIGFVMIGIFCYVYFVPFPSLRAAVAEENWPKAGASMRRIRAMVGINSCLGLAVTLVASVGRYLPY